MSNPRSTANADPYQDRSIVLSPDHKAIRQSQSLYQTAVVTVTDKQPERLLVAGRSNPKIGETVEGGQFAGYAIFSLSLEERATCPSSCDAIAWCSGNVMPRTRRHRIGDLNVFYKRIEMELAILLSRHNGVLLLLHELGDFPSVDYVGFWADMLAENDRLAIYGYTHRAPGHLKGDEVGDAVASLKAAWSDRFRIRWSQPSPYEDGAVVIDYFPETRRVAEGLVCPAQLDEDTNCASCGLCWDKRNDTIAFIRTGIKPPSVPPVVAQATLDRTTIELSAQVAKLLDASPDRRHVIVRAAADRQQLSEPPVQDVNPILAKAGPLRAIGAIPFRKPATPQPFVGEPPVFRMVDPRTLLVEEMYQRDLSARSVTHIRKIVENWDWSKFKPPACCETPDGLVITDGQHTAIAAACHPDIATIPVIINTGRDAESRASAFVAHNRDRLAMSQMQIFHAQVAAGDRTAMMVKEFLQRAGAEIPRNPPHRNDEKPGQIMNVAEAQAIFRRRGGPGLERLARVARLGKQAPVSLTAIRALDLLLFEPYFAETASQSDEAIGEAMAAIGGFDAAARTYAVHSGQNRFRAGAMLIVEQVSRRRAA